MKYTRRNVFKIQFSNFSELKRFSNLSCNFQLAQIGIIESLEHFTPKRIDLFSFFLCVP